MKPFGRLYLLFIFLSGFSIVKSQNVTAKRNLFDGINTTIPIKVSELEKNFSSTTGSRLQLGFADNKFKTLRGTILSTIQRYPNLKSVALKLTDFDGAVLSLSKKTNKDNTITYIGRIINEKYADGYELKTDLAGNYFFNKIKTEDLIQDHQ